MSLFAELKRVLWGGPVRAPLNGFVAYDEGFALKDNPHRAHTPEHSIWRDDWLFSAGRFCC